MLVQPEAILELVQPEPLGRTVRPTLLGRRAAQLAQTTVQLVQRFPMGERAARRAAGLEPWWWRPRGRAVAAPTMAEEQELGPGRPGPRTAPAAPGPA